ncbi:hypothetical protein PAMP_010799 [Pampus punctatissimus]
MVSWIISRSVMLVFGTLYPAYYSYKAVKTKNVKEYVRWMMYWIVFALYTVVETIADLTVAWFPLYYEMKTAFLIWLLSPYTRGASLIYRKCLHPLLSSRERISQQDNGRGNQPYQYSSHSANPAARRSQSTDAADGAEYFYDQEGETDEDTGPTFSEDEAVSQKGLRRSQSVKITRSRVRKDARYGSLKIKGKKRPALSSINYGM